MLAPAVMARATKEGVQLVEKGPLIEVHKGKVILAFHSDPNKAIAKALERLEEIRLRELDKRPQDREPVLTITKPLPASKLPQPVIKGSIIKSKYRDKYKKTGYSCGDVIAEELREYVVVLVEGRSRVSLDRLREVAVVNAVWRDSYAVLNPGQQRMTIGNRLRSKYNNGERIDIGGSPWELVIKDL